MLAERPTGASSESRPMILIVSHVVPFPPAAGNEIRILKMLAWLKQQGFGIVLLLNHSPVSAERRQTLDQLYDHVHFIDDDFGVELKPLLCKPLDKKACSDVLSLLLANTAFHRIVFGQDRQSKIKSDGVKKWLASDQLIQLTEHLCGLYTPCAVIAEYIFASPCLDVVPVDALKIIDTIDVFSRKQEQVLKYGIEEVLPCTRAEERNYLMKSDLVIAIQSHEARMLNSLVIERDIITVGIDFDVIPEIDRYVTFPGRVLVVGSDNPLNRHGLQEFHDHAWPLIRDRVPTATLRVLGKLANHLKTEDARVQRAGWVEDLDEEYRQAAVVINPTVAGTGLKIKSVEALCKGKALVATPNGVEGIDYTGEPPYLVGETWDRFAEAVVSLLSQADGRNRLERRALEFAQENFGSDKVYAQLGRKLQKLLQHHHD